MYEVFEARDNDAAFSFFRDAEWIDNKNIFRLKKKHECEMGEKKVTQST